MPSSRTPHPFTLPSITHACSDFHPSPHNLSPPLIFLSPPFLLRDNVITCPMQLEVVEILRELGFPCKSEVHWGPFSLDILIYPPSPPLGPVPAPAPSRSMALSHQTESQGQSDPSSSTSLPSLSSPGYTGPSSSLPFLPPSHHLSLPLVLEVDGRSHFLDTDSVTAPRGETVLKRKILAGMVGKEGTTREWAGGGGGAD